MRWNFKKDFFRGFGSVRKDRDLFVRKKDAAEVLFCGTFDKSDIQPRIAHVHSLIKSVRRFDLPFLAERGIPITATFGTYTTACSEYVIWAALTLMRNFYSLQNRKIQSYSCWSHNSRSEELSNKTVVLFGGNGEIGTRLKEMLPSLGMNPLVVDRDDSFDKAVEYIHRSKVVVSLLPSTKDTLGFFGHRIFSYFDGQFYIDVGRGGVCDLGALYAAIMQNKVSAAALDVFEAEPPDYSHPIFSHPDVVYTPHIAGVSGEWEYRTGIVAGFVVQHLEDKQLRDAFAIQDAGMGYTRIT